MVNDKDLLSFDYKKDFPLLAVNDVAYLDNSATTQKPACVIEAERDFISNTMLIHCVACMTWQCRQPIFMKMHALLCRNSSMPKASRRLFYPQYYRKPEPGSLQLRFG